MKVSVHQMAHQMWLRTLLLTVLFEGITLLARFGLGVAAEAAPANQVANITFGLRIHHGMIGALLLLALPLIKRHPAWATSGLVNWWGPVAGALILSDAIHHLLVLWLFTGDPQFHLTYPKQADVQ